ncbi:MAG: homocysteine S-methyltransferase family protein [Myxococcota bacterium]
MKILDGAIGTELISRGVARETEPFGASAIVDSPGALEALHGDYARAGATVHTANTFRTQAHRIGDRWRASLRAAVEIARQAVPAEHVLLGSLAPIEDCYRPDLSPGRQSFDAHREMSTALVDEGCDVVLCETFADEAEALTAVEASLRAGATVWLSLTAGPEGDLLSPKAFRRIGRRAIDLGAKRLLANCIGAPRIAPYVSALVETGAPVGVYANAGPVGKGIGWDDATDEGVARYVALAAGWADLGASLIGGCCGTGPRHIAALADYFDQTAFG